MRNGEESQAGEQALTSEEFRQIIGHFASGVSVVTAVLEDEPFGTTASAVTSLSLTPPMVLISLNAASKTGMVIDKTKRFGLNILSQAQADLAVRFARKGEDKFTGVEYTKGPYGMPLLDKSLATLECTVADQVQASTHIVFLANVNGASADIGAPLAYFRGEFGRLQLARDDHVLDDVRRRVLNRELPIQVPLSAGEIAERLDLPRDATHYALVHLTIDGLIAANPEGRFVVRPLTLDLIEDALHGRRVIEFGAVADAIGRISTDDLSRLRELADFTNPANHAGDVDSWVKAWEKFHESVVGLANSTAAVEAYQRLNTPPMVLSLTAARAAGSAGLESAVKAHRDHLALVEALDQEDAQTAFDIIRRHFDDSIAFARSGDSA